ncbi:site-specific integrase [Paenibacillus sp. CAU 1782]
MAGRTVKKEGSSWYYVLTHGKNTNGRPVQYKKRGFKTKRDALNALSELEHKLLQGTFVKPNKIIYQEYMIEQWLEDKQTRVKKQTVETYRWLVEQHILPSLGQFQISELTPIIIQSLYNRLTKEKALSDENIQKIHTLINDSLKKAERWGLISKNPAALVDRPKAIKKEVKVWNIEQVRIFLKDADVKARYYIAPFLGLMTGARIGEILGLRWKDVDLEKGCIRITQILSSDGKELMPHAKTSSGMRTIDLSPEAISYLKIHKKRFEEDKKHSLYQNLDLVVCTVFGTPTNKSNIRRYFNSEIKRLNLPRIRFHDTRHTHATLLLLQGVNPKIVSERLGHADVRISLDTYSHLLPSMQKETAKKFGEMLFGETKEENLDT